MSPCDARLWPTHRKAHQIDVAAFIYCDVLRYISDPGRYWKEKRQIMTDYEINGMWAMGTLNHVKKKITNEVENNCWFGSQLARTRW